MTADVFTLDDLRRILREGAGADESVDLDSDILDTPFEDLGYDSLAMLETGLRVGREYCIELDDDVLLQSATPRTLIVAVQDQLSAARAA